jgi:hypothetical protein
MYTHVSKCKNDKIKGERKNAPSSGEITGHLLLRWHILKAKHAQGFFPSTLKKTSLSY